MAASLKRYGPALGLLALGLVAWELWVRVRHVPDYVLPPPTQIARALFDSRALLVSHAVPTIEESVAGLVCGALAGVGFAVMMGLSATVMRALSPLVVASQTIPVIVLAPLLLTWFGYGLAPKVIIVALMTFFPVSIAMLSGISSIETAQLELMQSMGASRFALMRFVQFPYALPSAISGLRVSAAYAVGGAVIGEWTGAERGLGVFIDRSHSAYRVDQVFAGVIVIAALSVALFVGVDVLGRVLVPWHYRRRLARRSAGTYPPVRTIAVAPKGTS